MAASAVKFPVTSPLSPLLLRLLLALILPVAHAKRRASFTAASAAWEPSSLFGPLLFSEPDATSRKMPQAASFSYALALRAALFLFDAAHLSLPSRDVSFDRAFYISKVAGNAMSSRSRKEIPAPFEDLRTPFSVPLRAFEGAL